MSEVKVNKISPRTACGTTTLGDSGDSFVIPAGATITNNGTQVGFGRTGTVDWQTSSIKTATFTATSGEGYFCNTSGGAFTVNLPAGSAGAIVSVADYTRTFQTYKLTISPNGSEKLGGVAADLDLDVNGQSATFIYVDGTEGWINVQETETSQTGQPPYIIATGGTITTCGNNKIHTFTGPGTFTVCNVSSTAANNTVGYLVVAGGGGAGGCAGGGGGAGGFREGRNVPVDNFTASPLVADAPTNAVTVTATPYPITVGAGGAAMTTPSGLSTSGGVSTFSTITSAGGGYAGGRASIPAPRKIGSPGGSGGGNAADAPTSRPAGNTPPTTPSQGFSGGVNPNPGTYNSGGNGGGGATAQGADDGSPEPSGAGAPDGGAGATTSITGSPVARGGGGGGGGYGPHPNEGGCGGAGGGGRGARNNLPAPGGYAIAGTVNTGGGGGGGNNSLCSGCYGKGAAGGSGVVIIRYRYQ